MKRIQRYFTATQLRSCPGYKPCGRVSRVIALRVACVGLAFVANGWIQADQAGSTTTVHCRHYSGPYRVVGNRILDRIGHRFIPYAITVYGLSRRDWRALVSKDRAQIRAQASEWCVNAVRIQVAPHNLFSSASSQRGVNRRFVNALRDEVNLTQRLGLAVILTAQTEYVGQVERGIRQIAPTNVTLRYWKRISRIFRGKRGIMFDLFNEPRLFGSSTRETWSLWQNGGRHRGGYYLGMQQLVSSLRRAGIRRVFWVEGPDYAGTLALVPTHAIAGSDIVYAFHYPARPHNRSSWDAEFGHLARTRAVVDGEWTQYAAPNSLCWPHARALVPTYLSYLRKRRIGLVAWALRAGVLIRAPEKYDEPTKLRPNYSCTNGLDEGAGQLIRRYFYAQNGP